MNTFVASLLLLIAVSTTTFAIPGPGTNKKNRSTKLVHYKMGTFLIADKAKLRVNVDKELGGEVYIQLIDSKGQMYFSQTLESTEAGARLSLDLSDLKDGNYILKVSNGLEMEVRDVTITTPVPTPITRSITLL